MSNQKDHNFNPEPKMYAGTAEITWNGDKSHSRNVDHAYDNKKQGYLYANTFGTIKDNSFYVSLLTGIEADGKYIQDYERDVTPHHVRWALIFNGISHSVQKGKITGTFKNHYKKALANIDMELENGDIVNILFNLEERSPSE
ncbi:hypothetical protein PMI35_00045 [Pseudomonas sp. GM78]|uniref:hypothetical protein n=1 Tax=Pseudomonas sp. GM78 TaxID=1144337 RepID=UPI00026F7CE3|nr:hypothetical protein [Pseudomonas sp. GM78]EJN35495.1 hypothetical protein PMI35_00045 [Pseudomonas sp. GM78]